MSIDLIGKNPRTGVNLGYSHAVALTAVLTELSGKEVDFLKPTSEQQCKEWADILRTNLNRIKLIRGAIRETGRKYGFLVVQGMDVKREFTSGHYKHDVIDFKPSWDMARELDEYWEIVVGEFIEFLDKCGGIAKVVL